MQIQVSISTSSGGLCKSRLDKNRSLADCDFLLEKKPDVVNDGMNHLQAATQFWAFGQHCSSAVPLSMRP